MKCVVLLLVLSCIHYGAAFFASQRSVGSSVRLSMSDVIAAGTPFEAPKIGSSIVDVIGRTPMIKLNRLGSGASRQAVSRGKVY